MFTIRTNALNDQTKNQHSAIQEKQLLIMVRIMHYCIKKLIKGCIALIKVTVITFITLQKILNKSCSFKFSTKIMHHKNMKQHDFMFHKHQICILY